MSLESGETTKMKTPSKKNQRTDDNEGETNGGGDPYMSESNVVEDLPLAKSNDDQHLVESNKSEDGEQGKKKNKKKKQSEESKHKEFKSNECEDDNQGKKMKKQQKLIEGNTLKECNDFRSNGGEDGEQDKKMKKKKKKLSEESKHKECNEFKSNECEDDQEKKMKKKQKLIEGNTLNECNDFRSNGGEDDDQGKNMKKKLIQEGKHKEYNDIISNEGGDGDQCKTMEKNKLSHKRKSKENNDQVKKKRKKEAKAVTSEPPNHAHNESPNLEPDGPCFSDEVKMSCCDGLLRGKRFTPEEDEKIKKAVFDFIDSHGLGDNGLDKILHCKSHPEARGCWRIIAKVLPHRPIDSVYQRAHALLEKSGRCRWTPDEHEFIRKTYEQHGASWRAVADALGKSRKQVADAWRRVKYRKAILGRWSQEEYQTLFNLVNKDLRARSSEPYRKIKHGMLRDNICWEAIGHKLETRNSAFCCKKWYEKLTSPMVASGDWCDTDDFRLIKALYTLDACCMEEVDWDELLEHRSGDVCRKRWDQMVQHIGEHARKSFIEQVEILTQRFCPDLLEAREAFDNKPVICF